MGTKFTILTTNDMHGRFYCGDKTDIIDLSRLRTYRDTLERNSLNPIMIDAGDATQGSLLAILENGLLPIEIMNAVRYDAITLGNHEFDNIMDYDGTAELKKIILKSNSVFICCNVFKKDKTNYIESVYTGAEEHKNKNGRYHIIEKGNKKILFIGVTTPNVSMGNERMKQFDISGNSENDATVDKIIGNLVENVAETIRIAKTQCKKFDTIVLIAHLGMKGSYTSTCLAQKMSSDRRFDGVKLIIDGHSHEKINMMNYTNTGIAIIQANCNGKNFGEIELDISDSGEVKITKLEIRDPKHLMNYTQNNDVVTAYNKVMKKVKDSEYGNSYSSGAYTTLWGGAIEEEAPYIRNVLRAVNIARYVQTNMGELVSAAMIHHLQTKRPDLCNSNKHVIAGINGGGVRESIRFNREINDSELFYAFPSQIDKNSKEKGFSVFELSYNELIKMLAHSAGAVEYRFKQLITSEGRFLNTNGFKYTLKSSDGTKVVVDNKVIFYSEKDGRSVEVDLSVQQGSVLVCVPKYIAGGGDGYDIFVNGGKKPLCTFDDTPLFQIVGNYIKECSQSTESKNWPFSFAAVPTDVKYEGFNFIHPQAMSIKIVDNKEETLANEDVEYRLATDDMSKAKYESGRTDANGSLTIHPPAGASVLFVKAKRSLSLSGEMFIHTYFNLMPQG